MRIVNVSADLNSQEKIRQQGVVNLDMNVKAEVHAATQVEAEEAVQKARKTKRVQSKEI